MEDKDKEKDKEERGSNSCVLDLSIDEGEGKENKEENIVLNKSLDDIKIFSSKLTLKDNFENILDDIMIDEEESKEKSFRSKSIAFIKHQ